MRWGVSNFLEKKHYEGVWFNVISVTRGWSLWVGVNFPEKSFVYIAIEWPPMARTTSNINFGRGKLNEPVDSSMTAIGRKAVLRCTLVSQRDLRSDIPKRTWLPKEKILLKLV